MIEEIRIKQYKSIKDMTIGLQTPLTALIGKTGAGKTNVLEGIYLACILGFTGMIPKSYQSNIPKGFSVYFKMNVRNKICWYDFKFLFKQDRFYIQDRFSIKNGRKKIELFAKRDPFTVKFYYNSKLIYIPAESSGLSLVKKMIIMPELPEEFISLSSYVNEIAGVILDFSNIRYFRTHTLLDPALFLIKDFDLWQKTPFDVSEDLKFSFELYHLFKNKPKQFEKFTSQLRKLELLDNIQASEITAKDETGKDYHCMVWRFLVNGKAFPFTLLSQGTRRLILMLFDIYTNKTTLMLIQQLESGMHVALLMDYIQILKEHALEKKILFSSYSDHMFKELKPEQILYLHNKNNVTRAKRLKARHLGRLLSHISPTYSQNKDSGNIITINYRGRKLLEL
jgi:AAA15 family ATPase/GTPase